jgi:hypothetical protein
VSNEAYLVASKVTANNKSVSDISPINENDIVARSPAAVPIGWLSFFDTDCLVSKKPIHAMVSSMTEAIERFQSRKKTLIKTFPEFKAALDGLLRWVKARKAQQLTLDFTELWHMGPKSFDQQIKTCLTWFETPGPQNWTSLLNLASIEGYDDSTRTFAELHPDVPRKFHLVGYVNEVDRNVPEAVIRHDKKLEMKLDMAGLEKLAEQLKEALPKDSGFKTDDMMLDKFTFLDMGFVKNISGSISVTINKKMEELAVDYTKKGNLYQIRLGGTPAVLAAIHKAFKAKKL